MKPLTCAAARRRLHAFHDGELPVADQIAVEAHIDWCDECAAALADFRLMGTALRVGALGRDGRLHDKGAALAAQVVGLHKAEQDASLFARVQRIFDDMHLVYAGIGAAIASVLCIAIMLSMMRFATAERPDSLAAIVDLMATPGSSAKTIVMDPASHQRGTARFQAASENAEQDAVFALAAIVTRDGRLANFNRLRMSSRKSTREEVDLVEALMDAVSRARIDPTSIDGTRNAAAGMVWLVTSTTVRATKILGVDLPLPPATKKSITRLERSQFRAESLTRA
jgi:hypothetical protein